MEGLAEVQSDKALLVIDVQLGMLEENPPPYKGEELISTLQDLISRARAAEVPVIYVQHCDSQDFEPLHPSKEGWKIHPQIAPLADETVFTKHFPDAFQETGLQQELESRGIKKLVVAGMQTEFCVDTTTREAFSRGYDVTLVTDAHTTWDNKNLSAEQIIAHHNGVLGGWFATKKTAAEVEF